MVELIFETGAGPRKLRSTSTDWELCKQVDVKVDGVAVKEWRPFKFYTNLSTAFQSIINEKVRHSDASSLEELQKVLQETKDEVTRIYHGAFCIDTSVGDNAVRSGKGGTVGDDAVAATCNCGGDCGKQLVIEGCGVSEGEGCLPSVGKGMGASTGRPARPSRPSKPHTGATPKNAKDHERNAPSIQREPKKPKNGEVR